MACSAHHSTTRCVEPSHRRQCFPTRINDAGRTLRRAGWRSRFIGAIGSGVSVTREVAILPTLSPRQRGQLAALVATDLGFRLPQTDTTVYSPTTVQPVDDGSASARYPGAEFQRQDIVRQR